ncbi:MAG: PRC-barrel domain-containing protein [Chloroflexi bacterium]|nr:PRC-barrel domain-containing protein [Chloroflexota bacterium]
MEVNIGARAVSKEGRDIGVVNQVVIEPVGNELVSVVVHATREPVRDMVVPIGEIERATKDNIYLKLTMPEVETLPDFVETDYAPPPRHWLLPPMYSRTHVLVPVSGPADLGQPTVEQPIHRHALGEPFVQYAAPQDITISEGTAVYCADGTRVGSVDEVITDQRTNRITSFVVRKGQWFPKDIVVPMSLVARTQEYRITLDCGKGELHNLPSPKH